MVFAPTKPVSLTPLPSKSATPFTAFMVTVPLMVAPVAVRVIEAVDPTTVFPEASLTVTTGCMPSAWSFTEVELPTIEIWVAAPGALVMF